jgi:hypothetical protein
MPDLTLQVGLILHRVTQLENIGPSQCEAWDPHFTISARMPGGQVVFHGQCMC